MLTRSTVNRERVKEEMGNWLGQLAPWDAYATWTFSRIVTVNGAMFWADRHIQWLQRAAERGHNGGLIHLHALLGNVKHMNFYCGNRNPSPAAPATEARRETNFARNLSCCLTHAWPCGYATVFPYDPTLGAKHYVSKYVTKDLAEWNLFGLPLSTQTAFGHKGAEFTSHS